MLAVTQLEVYVLARGRWTLHARYAGEDNKEALWDAQATERSTGYPAKIVRETFFPELNDSERITTYISPKAQKAGKGRPVGTVARPQVPLQSRARPQTAPRLNAAQMMLRVLVAAAFSVVAAAVMAFVIKYVLQSFADIGISISPAATSMIMTYSWIAMFLLFFFSLFRSRLPLHRLLADMWHASARPAAAVAAKVKPVKLKLRPKHDRGATSPETLKAWQDLRMRRGDPDIFSSPDDLVPDLPLSDGTLTQFPETKPAESPVAGKAPEKTTAKAPDKAQEKAQEDKAAQDKAIQDRIAKAKEKSAKEKAAEKALQEESAAAKAAADKTALGQKTQDAIPLPPTLREEDDYAHTALQRFIADVIKPAAAASMRDDPVARRGIALVVAGAIDGIAARPEARGLDTRALLAWGLRVAGLSDGAAALFLENHDALSRDPVNSSLVASGQGLMTDMIPLQSPNTANFARVLADAFAVWRTPFGTVSQGSVEQPGAPPPAAEAAFDIPGDEPDAPATYADLAFTDTPHVTNGLRDVFMLTELRPLSRHDDAVQDDARMAVHNDRIRAALSAGGGQEIKHTGKGIFARFADPATALATAKDLQRDLGRSIALSLIGNADAAEDPVLSPALFLRAEAAMGSTGDGQASVEAHVIGEHQRLGQPTDLVILAAPPAAAAETAVA